MWCLCCIPQLMVECYIPQLMPMLYAPSECYIPQLMPMLYALSHALSVQLLQMIGNATFREGGDESAMMFELMDPEQTGQVR